MTTLAAVLISLAATAAPASPAAQPPAPSSAACSAPAPAVGHTISGPVLQVIDGATLCVALGPTPADWVKLSLTQDASAPDRPTLMAAVFARRLSCVVDSQTAAGVTARCVVELAPMPQPADVRARGGKLCPTAD